MEEYIRAGALLMILAPMAVSDWRERMVRHDIMCVSLGIAACFFAYDVVTGAYGSYSVLALIGTVLCLIVGLVVYVMYRVFRITGLPDAVLIFVAGAVAPSVSGVPAGLAAVMCGYVASMLYIILYCTYRNITDVIRHRPACLSLHTYIKRPGERFAVPCEVPRLGTIQDDTIRDESGNEYFVGAEQSGMRVTTVSPMITMYMAGAGAVLAWLYLTSFDATHVIRIILDLQAYLSDPGISWNPGFGLK